jgi:hypothetical protein
LEAVLVGIDGEDIKRFSWLEGWKVPRSQRSRVCGRQLSFYSGFIPGT